MLSKRTKCDPQLQNEEMRKRKSDSVILYHVTVTLISSALHWVEVLLKEFKLPLKSWDRNILQVAIQRCVAGARITPDPIHCHAPRAREEMQVHMILFVSISKLLIIYVFCMFHEYIKIVFRNNSLTSKHWHGHLWAHKI